MLARMSVPSKPVNVTVYFNLNLEENAWTPTNEEADYIFISLQI